MKLDDTLKKSSESNLTKNAGYLIRYMDNPSEAVKLSAVTQDGKNIQYIDKPSIKIQLAAVTQNGFAIELIDNPSEKVQLAAIKRIAASILFIDNPSKNVLITALLNLMLLGDINSIHFLLEKYSDRNYPEFAIIRQSIENDK